MDTVDLLLAHPRTIYFCPQTLASRGSEYPFNVIDKRDIRSIGKHKIDKSVCYSIYLIDAIRCAVDDLNILHARIIPMT